MWVCGAEKSRNSWKLIKIQEENKPKRQSAVLVANK